MAPICEWCLFPLGTRDARKDESGIERMVTESLCNPCAEIWRILHGNPYWQAIEWEHMLNRDQWKRELGESNGESNGETEGSNGEG